MTIHRAPVLFYWLWASLLLQFAVIEGIALWHEWRDHAGDGWTATHFLVTFVPMGVRIALLAWLVYHFIWQHVRS
jgi:hypothetical protein